MSCDVNRHGSESYSLYHPLSHKSHIQKDRAANQKNKRVDRILHVFICDSSSTWCKFNVPVAPKWSMVPEKSPTCQHVPLKLDTCGYIHMPNKCSMWGLPSTDHAQKGTTSAIFTGLRVTMDQLGHFTQGAKETRKQRNSIPGIWSTSVTSHSWFGFTQGKLTSWSVTSHTLGLSIWSSLACTAARFRASWGDASVCEILRKSIDGTSALPMRPVSSAPLSSKLSVVSRSSRLPVFNGTSARDYQKQIHTHQARWNNIVCYLTLLMLPSTNRNQWNGPCSPTLKNRRYVQKSTPSLLLMTALKSKAQNHQKQFSERHSLQTNIHALRSAYMLWNNSPDPTNQSPRFSQNHYWVCRLL
jgi:hypothetical protein